MKRRSDFPISVIKTLLEIIDQEIKDGLSINYLSMVSGYSRWHLQRIFKSSIGVSLGTYIRYKRVKRAANDIVKIDTRLIDVVVDYNFSSQSAFCRTFKTVYGITPGSYRRTRKSVD